MNKSKELPTPQYLREALEYNPSTGELRWKARPISHFSNAKSMKSANTRWAGKHAGILCMGRYSVSIGMSRFLAHRVCWAIHNGRIPDGLEIDHIDGDASNNRIANLRISDRYENNVNKGLTARNTTGVRGVRRVSGGKWEARIRVRNHVIGLGRYRTMGEAALCYAKASIKYHGEFSPFTSRQ